MVREWLSQHFDPEIGRTAGSSEHPPSFSFYVLNKAVVDKLGFQAPNLFTSAVPLKEADSFSLRVSAGVYQKGEWGNPYFQQKTVKVFKTKLGVTK